LHGKDITELDVRKRDIAFVYQEFVNYPPLPIFENIASPLRVRGEDKKSIEHKVQEVARLLGLDGVLDRHPPSLSGGQQQRVAIARALTKDAEVILLDEPLANLDYKLREDLRRELPRLFEGKDKIVIYATTDPNEAFLLGDKTVVLDAGRVKQVGTAGDVFTAPESLAAARTMSEFPFNLLPARIENSTCVVANTLEFPLPEHMCSLCNGDYTLGFRAEQFSFKSAAPTSVACDASIAVIEITGNETIVHVDVANQPCIAVVEGSKTLEVGSTVTLHLNPDKLFLFDNDGRTVATPLVSVSL
jgi:glycerol transport system ATP-binding protein